MNVAGQLVEGVLYPYDVARVVSGAVRAARRHFTKGRALVFGTFLMQIYFTAVQAAPVVLLTAVAAGGLSLVECTRWLSGWVDQAHLVTFTVSIIVRELAPLLTALIIIGRSATAISSELGGMKVHREIELYKMMRIDPAYFVVAPRLAGVCLGSTCLGLLFAAAALVGGYMVAAASPEGLSFSLLTLLESVSSADAIAVAVKSAVFGLTAGSIACYQGLAVKRSVTEIPQAGTKTFVRSVAMCLLLEVILTIFILPD